MKPVVIPIEALPAFEPKQPEQETRDWGWPELSALVAIMMVVAAFVTHTRTHHAHQTVASVTSATQPVTVTFAAAGTATPLEFSTIVLPGSYTSSINPTSDTKPPKDAPPSKIVIGPFTYSVKYESMFELGRTNRETTVIYLRNDLSPSQLRETLIHEIMHGCIATGNWYGVGNFGRDNEDHYIEAIAPIWLMVLRDNPQLVKWLEKRS